MAPVLAFNIGATVAFALLAFAAQRKRYQVAAAGLAAVAWLCLAVSVALWFWQ